MRQIVSISGPVFRTRGPTRAGLSPLRGPEIAAWIVIGIIAAATAVLMIRGHLSFDWPSATRPALACVVFLAGALVYRTWRPDERIATTLVAVAQVIVFTAVAAPFSYAVARAGGPLWDDTFMAWDLALGLDWHAYLVFVNAHPCLAFADRLAYQSLSVQMIAAIGVLGLTGRLAACRRFILAVALAGLITIVISGLMAAVGVPAHLGLRASDFPNVDAQAGYVHLAILHGLRAGTLHVVSLTGAEGIITFPSFHAGLGLIFAWAFWSVPSARWPGLALNAMLIAATPIGGGHYFVDIISGSAIALLAIMAATCLDQAATQAARIEPI